MTALLSSIICTIIIIGVGAYLVVWTLANVKTEVLRTGAIIVYGLCFTAAITKLFIEVIKAAL